MKLNLQEWDTSVYRYEVQGNICRIWMPRSLAAADALPLTSLFEQVRGAYPEVRQLICDFEQTRFMDGMGLSALVAVHKLMRQHGQLVLDHVPSQVALVLTTTGLDQVLHVRLPVASGSSGADAGIRPSFQKELVAC